MITILLYGQSNAGALRLEPQLSTLLDFIEAETGQSARLLNATAGGETISYFSKGNAGYADLMSVIAAADPAVTGDTLLMIWKQGESDMGTAGYVATFDTLCDDIVDDLSLTRDDLAVFIGSLATNTNNSGAYTDANWSAMQKDLFDCGALENCFYSHSDQDAVLIDDAHYNEASYVRCARRFAQSICCHLFETEAHPANFFITNARVVDETTTLVSVTHKLGTDITPTEDITGFDVSDDDGETYVAATGERRNATSVLLTHESLALTPRLVRHGYGLLAEVNLKDNSALAVPLNFTPAPIETTSLVRAITCEP